MIEDRIIVCFASNWHYDPTSKHHIMRLLSRRNHVVWVNYHASRRPQWTAADAGSIKAKLRQIVQGPTRVARNITVLTPLIVPAPGNRAVAAVNQRLLVRQIQAVLNQLPEWPVQIWTFAPDVDYVCGHLGEECVIYYCVDEFSEFSGYDAAQTRAAEARLVQRADLVVTTSRALYEAKRKIAENVVLVPHGVDYEHFAKKAPPDLGLPTDIDGLPRPLLGFWGLIQDWIDVPLLAEVAKRRPEWSIVLIGEVLADVSLLAGLRNVHLLGRRTYASLPSFAGGFDIGLIPFKLNALTRAVNPIKLREYLSAGLPVVSTPLPEVQRYRPLVSTAGDAAGFVAACADVLAWSAGQRDAFVHRAQAAMRGETWAAKVEEVCGYVRDRVEEPRASIAVEGEPALQR